MSEPIQKRTFRRRAKGRQYVEGNKRPWIDGSRRLISITFPDDLFQELAREAEQRDCSFGQVVRERCRPPPTPPIIAYIERSKRQDGNGPPTA